MLLHLNAKHPEPRKIAQAVTALERGSVIAYPTDSVYGLGCDLLSKQELLSIGWPDRFVDESNLKVTIASLRKIFAEDPAAPRYIATVAGRGYRFVAAVVTHASVG